MRKMMIVLVLLVATMLAGAGGGWMNAEYKGLLASTAQPPRPPAEPPASPSGSRRINSPVNSTSQMVPENTYAFVAGTLEWKNSEKFPNDSKERRMDQVVYEQLRVMGVPDKNMVLLLDKEATNERMLKALDGVASRAGRDATLIFYYAGHGYPVGDHFFFASYDAKAGDDAPEGFDLADITKIVKKSYKGKRVLLMADCCYAGALGHVARDLSEAGFLAGSVAPCTDWELNTENWTFSYTVVDVLRGRPMIDLDKDGHISVFEFQDYVRKEMAHVEEQRSSYSLFGLEDSFRLAKVAPDEPEGEPVPAPYYPGQFVGYPSGKVTGVGRIVAFKDGQLKLEIQGNLDREIVWKAPKEVTPCEWPNLPKKPTPKTPPEPLSEELALKKATVGGKYSNLLRKILVKNDFAQEGEFNDYGMWRASRYAGYKDLPDGYWVYVYPHWYIFGTKSKPEDSGNPVVDVGSAVEDTPSIGGYNVYFGQLHSHSNLSDGRGTPDKAYKYARDTAGLDFFSLADHCSYPYDTPDGLGGDGLTASEYQALKDAADRHNRDGEFVAFWGFEWTSDLYEKGSPGMPSTLLGKGHVTVVNSPDHCEADEEPTNDLGELAAWLDKREAVAFFNHPGQYGTDFDHFNFTRTDRIVGMELWNRSKDYYGDGRWYNDALGKGWRIGAAGSQDNHGANWGTENEWRMVVLAPAKTRAAIYAAIKARRFYSSRDRNLAMSFTCNSSQMGSKVLGPDLSFAIEAFDGDNEVFTRIELLKKGKIFKVWTPDDRHPNVTHSTTGAAGDYFYAVAYQGKDWAAISSPIFVEGIKGQPGSSRLNIQHSDSSGGGRASDRVAGMARPYARE